MVNVREPVVNYGLVVEPAPMPPHIPEVPEIGASSAPLMSASFFIGARCKPYGDDYLLCKKEANGRGELDCLSEGRRVTRCAISVLSDIKKHCAKEFFTHWDCLDRNELEFRNCRPAEAILNSCVYKNLGLEKKIPGTAEGTTPIHLREKYIYKPYREDPASIALAKAKASE
ncbi:hypothetical protein CANCADRAFT_117615 [Tortispora caseinolytica NRRL Y-17796]|uniref:NADH-ubiquinone oxidoreductase n=1 Tax=Tortispora caseinolytica NRRL Y-17796 TaxID=767744 RepID=A0A1E4THC3_9ASCO|nr:hypothetical protein CANCADRAFT_117615 [Tortispora caseinolytica NRRL Y-17796]